MRASIAEVRRKQISEILAQKGNIQTDDIARAFDVTTETIRKNIRILQQQGLAIKCHGGAMAVGEGVINMLSKRTVENRILKEKIAAKAVEFIHEHAIIYLGPGSTTLSIAQNLAGHSGLTIFTSSLSAAQVLADSQNRVYVLGGLLNGPNMSMHGMWSNDVIQSIAPNIAFLGSSGVNGYLGPTCGNFEEAETLKRIMCATSKVIVVCDSSKFGWAGLTSYANWDSIDVLISDANLPEAEQKLLRQKTQILLADAGGSDSGR